MQLALQRLATMLGAPPPSLPPLKDWWHGEVSHIYRHILTDQYRHDFWGLRFAIRVRLGLHDTKTADGRPGMGVEYCIRECVTRRLRFYEKTVIERRLVNVDGKYFDFPAVAAHKKLEEAAHHIWRGGKYEIGLRPLFM